GMIIKWWEIRRLYFNLVIFATILLLSLILSALGNDTLIGTNATYPASLGIRLLLSFFVLQVPANIWYTGGWAADLLIKKVLRRNVLSFGPWAQAIGLVFSLIFTAFIMIMMWGWPERLVRMLR